MECSRCFSWAFLLLFLMGFSASSASTFISDGVFESRVSTSRSLLQTKKACPVNFEFLNYTIITSKCKGPQYTPELCCGALKDFACPYTNELNDLTNDCSSTMFSYINLYGKYPPGLFANECREGKLGLECPALPPSALADANVNASYVICSPLMLLILAAGFIAMMVNLL